jgi:hypothetical protein
MPTVATEKQVAEQRDVREALDRGRAEKGIPPNKYPPESTLVVADPIKTEAAAQAKAAAEKKAAETKAATYESNESEMRRFNKRQYTDRPQLLPVFGYPPANLLEKTNQQMYNSFPVATFLPCKPNVSFGQEIFILQDEWDLYLGLLSKHGYTLPEDSEKGIKVAFLSDNFPTDSFTNEYGENFLQGFTDGISSITGTLAQMSGNVTGSSMLKQGARGAGAAVDMIAPMLGITGTQGAQTADSLIKGAEAGYEKMATSMGASGAMGAKLLSSFDRIMGGARLDFPSLWKSSTFQPSYSLTVRLYNPYPQNIEATKKYILGPMVALMLLACPRTIDGGTYTWPWFQKITCPGIFELDPGMITNLTIIKGGDQQQISFQNSMGIVDIRIDIGSLYNTMVSSEQEDKVGGRPTVRKYAEIMEKQKRDVFAIGPPGSPKNVNTTPINNPTLSPKVPAQTESSESRFLDGRYIRPPRADSPAASPPKTKSIADQLISLLPQGFKISVN